MALGAKATIAAISQRVAAAPRATETKVTPMALVAAVAKQGVTHAAGVAVGAIAATAASAMGRRPELGTARVAVAVARATSLARMISARVDASAAVRTSQRRPPLLPATARERSLGELHKKAEIATAVATGTAATAATAAKTATAATIATTATAATVATAATAATRAASSPPRARPP